MKGCAPTVGTSTLLALAMISGWSCTFDRRGVPGEAGDAQVVPDSSLTDALPSDALPSDAGPHQDAGNPCQGLNPPWWDHSWHRRRPIDLGTVPENYTVTLELADSLQADVESNARTDLEDLRVLRYDGSWMELHRTVRSEPTYLRIRFRVQEDQTGLSGQPRYFLYYDHPSATAAPGDFSQVFLFFDDFERVDLGIGTVYGQWDANQILPGSWSIENGELIQDGTSELTTLVIRGLAGRLSVGFVISYLWLSDPFWPDAGPVFHWDSIASDGYYLERQTTDAVLFTEPTHTEQDRLAMGGASDDAWHRHTLRYHGGTLTFHEDSVGPQFTLPLTPSGTETVGVATYCIRASPTRFDNLVVQLYQEPEPIPTLGSELYCAQP